jgi:5'-phosphate synthase pdxT subunit
MRVGVLALQGDFANHASCLAAVGATPVEVRLAVDLRGVDGLVLPGGESTTISLLLESSGLLPVLSSLLVEGMPVLGTCAGLILLAKSVLGGRPDQVSLGRLDITVQRNGFGRQLESFETELEVPAVASGRLQVAFIRAPVVVEVGSEVEVLARLGDGGGAFAGSAVLVRQGSALGASFHPEIVGDVGLHELFVAGL